MVRIKNKLLTVVLLISILLIVPAGVHAQNLYVLSIKAAIFSMPSLGSQIIAEAKKGEVLRSLEKKGFWFKVKYNEKTGWVSGLLVGNKPPSGKVSILEKTEEKLKKGSRRRASAFATAAAARGLAEERARISDKFKVDYTGLEWIEKINISDEEADLFIKKGTAERGVE
ncbi:MAG: SH3 domain-containing protein [Nitrospirae bacterium]|nr:SH3 domain-containing protein [Nitrospirota bacterium]